MDKSIRTFSSNEALIQERRNHIAECAIKVFTAHGFDATSMRELARACDMAQGALYNYIGSKDDILHLICRNQSAGATGLGLRQILKNSSHASRTEALVKCIEEYLRVTDGDTQYVLFFNREINRFSHDDRQMLIKSQMDIQQFFEQLLVEGVQNGEFEIESPSLMAHNILMIGQNWVLRKWFLKRLFSLKEYTAKETEYILRLIKKQAQEN